MRQKELLNRAINLIVEYDGDVEMIRATICTHDPEWCEKHCDYGFCRECVLHYLEFGYLPTEIPKIMKGKK